MRNNYWMALFILLACLFLGIVTHKANAADVSMCGPITAVTKRLEALGEKPVLAFVYEVDVPEPQLRILFAGKTTYTLLVASGEVDGHVCTMYNGDVIGTNAE